MNENSEAFTPPGTVYVYDTKSKGHKLCYHGTTVRDARKIAVDVVARRIAAAYYSGTDLIGARAIVAAGRGSDMAASRAGDSASAFLRARKHLTGEGYEHHQALKY